MNPQYLIKLEEEDEDDEGGERGCTFLVGLIQKHRRRQRKMGEDMHTIGFGIYEVRAENGAALCRPFPSPSPSHRGMTWNKTEDRKLGQAKVKMLVQPDLAGTRPTQLFVFPRTSWSFPEPHSYPPRSSVLGKGLCVPIHSPSLSPGILASPADSKE